MGAQVDARRLSTSPPTASNSSSVTSWPGPLVHPFGDVGPQRAKHRGALPYPFDRDVLVGVATPEEDGRSVEQPPVAGGVDRLAEAAAAEGEHPAVASRTVCRELQRETGALREPAHDDPFVRNDLGRLLEYRAHAPERRGEVWLVALNRREKGVRVPPVQSASGA